MGMIIFFVLFGLLLLGGIYNSLRAMTHTYDKEIAAELANDRQGWKLVSVRHTEGDEHYDSPYYSFFKIKISGARSITLVATVEKKEQQIEIWVNVNTFLFWVTSIGYEPKHKKRHELTQEQKERLL